MGRRLVVPRFHRSIGDGISSALNEPQSNLEKQTRVHASSCTRVFYCHTVGGMPHTTCRMPQARNRVMRRGTDVSRPAVSRTNLVSRILRNYPQDRYKFTRYNWYARRRIRFNESKSLDMTRAVKVTNHGRLLG